MALAGFTLAVVVTSLARRLLIALPLLTAGLTTSVSLSAVLAALALPAASLLAALLLATASLAASLATTPLLAAPLLTSLLWLASALLALSGLLITLCPLASLLVLLLCALLVALLLWRDSRVRGRGVGHDDSRRDAVPESLFPVGGRNEDEAHEIVKEAVDEPQEVPEHRIIEADG
jgi:hypothetical protein